jgi:N-acetyl-alpha-D-muramate 1-phosphate uridylyltransferase
VIGFCLAAGAGSRLQPLTRATPKALLAPAGRPLVDLAVEALLAAGATRVVVNAHHGADLLAAHLAGRPEVEVVVEPVLLGTGGGLINAARLGLLGRGDAPVLVTAADHVVDPGDLAALADFLDQTSAPLVVGLVPAGAHPFGLRLEGVAGAAGGRVVRDQSGPWDSAGAYAIRAGFLAAQEPGPITLSERVLGPPLERGEVAGLPFRGPMADAGTLTRLLDVSAGLLAGRWPYQLPPGWLWGEPGAGPVPEWGEGDRAFDGSVGGTRALGRSVAGSAPEALEGGRAFDGSEAGPVLERVGTGPVFVAAGAGVDPTAVLAGPVVLDAGSRVGAGAVVTRAVVGAGAVVGPGARVVGSFLGPGARVPPGTRITAALVPRPSAQPGSSQPAFPQPGSAQPAPSQPATPGRAAPRRLAAEPPGGGA